MDGCPCGCGGNAHAHAPNRPSSIPRPDRSQNIPSPFPSSRNRVPCPYPGSRIPTPVPPYTGQPLYLPSDTNSEWPGMRANFTQEVRNFQYTPDFFDENRPLIHSTMITGSGRRGRMQLQRSNKPDMAVNQPIPERPQRMRTPVPQASRVQSRPQTSQVSRVQTRQTPRAISAGPAIQQPPQQPRLPAVQPVRSTGAIPRVPGVAMRVPSRSPQSPSDSRRQRTICSSAPPRRPPSVRAGPPLDAAQLRARQQAQSLGVSQQKPSRPQPRPDEYMGDFELMERVAQQEHAIGVSDQRPPRDSCFCPDDSFDEFEELEKAYDKLNAPTAKAPYMSPDSLKEFEQLERETQARTTRRPLGGQSALPRPKGSQGPVLDDAQLRARQQARSLGVTRQKPSRAAPPRSDEYMGEFEMMERLAKQEHETGVRAQAPPSGSCRCKPKTCGQAPPSDSCCCKHKSFDEYEELEKAYEKVYAPSDRVPYMSPEGLKEFEQLEQGTHLEAVAAPANLQNLLEMPSVHLEAQSIAQQGPRATSELRNYLQRQWDTNAAVAAQWQSQEGSSSNNQSSRSGQWCPPECHGLK